MRKNIINLTVMAKDSASKVLKGISTSIAGVGKAALAATTAGLSLLIGAIAGITLGLVKLGSKFNAAKNIIMKGTGATGDALKGLMNEFKMVNKQVPDSMDTVAAAIADVNTRLGLTGTQLRDTAHTFLNFARVTDSEVGPAIRQVTRLMADWSVPAEDAEKTMNLLTKVSQDTGATIDQLTQNTVTYGVQLRALGFTMPQSIALLGKFEKEGVATEKAMSGLSIGLARMAKEGIKDPAKGFTELSRRIKEAKDVGTATRIAMDLLGAKAGPDFALAIREGRFELEDYMKTLENTDFLVNDLAFNTLTLGDKSKIVGKKISTAMEPLASKVFDVMYKSMDRLLEFMDGFEEGFNERIPEIKSALKGLGDAIKNLIGPVKNLTGTTGLISSEFDAGSSAGVSFGKIIEKIINGITSLVNWLTEHKEDIKNFFTTAFNTARSLINIISTIISTLGSVKNALSNLATSVGEAIQTMRPYAQTIIDTFSTGIGHIASLFSFIGSVVRSFVGLMSYSFNQTKGLFFGSFGSPIMSFFSTFLKHVTTVMGAIGVVIYGAFKSSIQGVKTILNGFINGLNNVMGQINQTIREANKLPGMKINEIKPIKPLAKGTPYWKGGPAMINEAGPEIVDLPTGTRVYPADKSEKMSKEKPSITFNNYFSENMSIEQVASRLAFQLGGVL